MPWVLFLNDMFYGPWKKSSVRGLNGPVLSNTRMKLSITYLQIRLDWTDQHTSYDNRRVTPLNIFTERERT
jgi:hypothetical protein